MKSWGLRILVLAGLAGAALWLRERSPAPQDAKPPDAVSTEMPSKAAWSDASRTVNDFFQAASDGDDETYLRLVDGQLRRSLEQSRSELGVDGFRQSLRRSAAGIKGLAVTPGDRDSADEMTLDVEIIFADRNEQQRVRLARKSGAWVITSIDQAQMIKPAVPYGTPVFGDLPSESQKPKAKGGEQ